MNSTEKYSILIQILKPRKKVVIQDQSNIPTSASSTVENQQQQEQQQRETPQRKSNPRTSKSAKRNLKRQNLLCVVFVTTVPPPPPDRTVSSSFDPLLAAKHYLLNILLNSSTPLSRADICSGVLNEGEDLFYAIEVLEALIQSDYLTIYTNTAADGLATEKLEVNTSKLASHPLPPPPADTVEEAESFVLELISFQKTSWISGTELRAYLCLARFSKKVRRNALDQLHKSTRIVFGSSKLEFFHQLYKDTHSLHVLDAKKRHNLLSNSLSIFRNATPVQICATLLFSGFPSSVIRAMLSENIEGAEFIQHEEFLAKMCSEEMQQKYGYGAEQCNEFEEMYRDHFLVDTSPAATETDSEELMKRKKKKKKQRNAFERRYRKLLRLPPTTGTK